MEIAALLWALAMTVSKREGWQYTAGMTSAETGMSLERDSVYAGFCNSLTPNCLVKIAPTKIITQTT